MPVKSDVFGSDWCCKPAFIAAPLGITGVAWYFYLKNADQLDWFGKLKKPTFMVTNPTLAAVIDLATVAPIGYAASLICKEALVASGDRQTALRLYGASLLVWTASFPVYINSKNLNHWIGVMSLGTGVFTATAFSFYKINKDAAWMFAPLIAWFAYQTLGLMVTYQNN